MNNDLDQMFTTAGFAMKFAADNWAEFCEFAERIISRPTPISRNEMLDYGLRIALLANPGKMPL